MNCPVLTPVIYTEGSTPARSRLYQMGIAYNLEEIKEDFEMGGLQTTTGSHSNEVATTTLSWLDGDKFVNLIVKLNGTHNKI